MCKNVCISRRSGVWKRVLRRPAAWEINGLRFDRFFPKLDVAGSIPVSRSNQTY